MKRSIRTRNLMAAVGLAHSMCHAAHAQAAYPPLVQVAPGIYQPAAGQMAPAGRIVPGRIAAAFSLSQTDEAADNNTLRSRYTATGVAVTLVPTGSPGGGVRLVGNVEVLTETTTDASGAGVIHGTLTLTGTSSNGIVAQLITARLDGTYGDGGGPLVMQGQLSVPATTFRERPLTGTISATLDSNASLETQLTGLVSVLAP